MLLELILTLPIMFISLLAVVEFGLIMANLKQVAVVSREGGRLAAEATPLNATTANLLRQQLDRRLQAAGFGPSATEGVTLQETRFGGGPYTDGTCGVPLSPPMPSRAVRVTVRVNLDQLTPNLLQPFGYDISGRYVEHTTTFRHEP